MDPTLWIPLMMNTETHRALLPPKVKMLVSISRIHKICKTMVCLTAVYWKKITIHLVPQHGQPKAKWITLWLDVTFWPQIRGWTMPDGNVKKLEGTSSGDWRTLQNLWRRRANYCGIVVRKMALLLTRKSLKVHGPIIAVSKTIKSC